MLPATPCNDDDDDYDDDLPLASERSLHSPAPVPAPVQISSLPPSSAPSDVSRLPSLTEFLLRPKARLGQAPPAISPRDNQKRAPSPEQDSPSKKSRTSLREGLTLPARIQKPSVTHPPQQHTTSPISVGEILVPDSDSAELPSNLPASFPEFRLDDAVDIQDEYWEDHIKYCKDALGKLGFKAPKSKPQLLAMILVLHRLNNLIFVLPTGFGKSLLYLFLAMVPVDLHLEGRLVGGNIIVVTPYTALLVDQYNKSRELGVPAFNWQNRSGNHVPAHTRIIFIQPESFNSRSFQELVNSIILSQSITYFNSSWLESWNSRGFPPFIRIVIDEFHNTLEGVPQRRTKTWEPLLKRLFAFDVQLILMTATMPHYLRSEYRALLGRGDFSILAESSDRPNVAYHFVPASEELTKKAKTHQQDYQYQDIVQELILSLLSLIQASETTQDRILVFFPTPKIVESFAEEYGYLWHDSNRTKLALQATLDSWDTAVQKRVLVGTTALAEGLDRHDVRYVIVGNVSFGHSTLTQMLGRAGRDGLSSDLFFIGNHGADIRCPPSTGNPSLDAQHALNATQGCQRKFSMISLDGPSLGAYECNSPPDTSDGPAHPCGNCAPGNIQRLAVLAVVTATQAHVQLLRRDAQEPPAFTGPLQRSSSTSTVRSSSNHNLDVPVRTGLGASSSTSSVAPFKPTDSQKYYGSQGPMSKEEQDAMDAIEAGINVVQVCSLALSLSLHTYLIIPRPRTRSRRKRSGSQSRIGRQSDQSRFVFVPLL